MFYNNYKQLSSAFYQISFKGQICLAWLPTAHRAVTFGSQISASLPGVLTRSIAVFFKSSQLLDSYLINFQIRVTPQSCTIPLNGVRCCHWKWRTKAVRREINWRSILKKNSKVHSTLKKAGSTLRGCCLSLRKQVSLF